MDQVSSPSFDPYANIKATLAIPRNPLTIVASPLAWRSVLYCATSVVFGWFSLLVGIVGFLGFPWVSEATHQIERRRVMMLGLAEFADPDLAPPSWQTMLRGKNHRSLATWATTVAFAMVDTVPGIGLSIAIIAGVTWLQNSLSLGRSGVDAVFSLVWTYLWLTIGLYVAWALAAVQAFTLSAVVRPDPVLGQQVAQLTNSRSELVDLFEAERRRIERDLHDGAQQHLVVSTMRLGEAVYWLDKADTDSAREAVLQAQSSVENALSALRDTIHGIHPQVLSDRGLLAAVEELAARQPVPTAFVLAGTAIPLPPQLESAAYYVASEALTNVSRHSRATQATIRLDYDARRLLLQVLDNGAGGATLVPGHGISGLAERTGTAGGTLELSSPVGGPTVVSVTFPYHRHS